MKLVTCPHCSHRHIVMNKVPKDVIVVLPCPQCQEFMVFFREKVIAIKRDIIDNGTFDERKEHIAEVIARFLEEGVPWTLGAGDDDDDEESVGEPEMVEGEVESPEGDEPITQREVDEFTRIELQRIDDPTYFRRLFG